MIEMRFELYLDINAILYNLKLFSLTSNIKTVTIFFV